MSNRTILILFLIAFSLFVCIDCTVVRDEGSYRIVSCASGSCRHYQWEDRETGEFRCEQVPPDWINKLEEEREKRIWGRRSAGDSTNTQARYDNIVNSHKENVEKSRDKMNDVKPPTPLNVNINNLFKDIQQFQAGSDS